MHDGDWLRRGNPRGVPKILLLDGMEDLSAQLRSYRLLSGWSMSSTAREKRLWPFPPPMKPPSAAPANAFAGRRYILLITRTPFLSKKLEVYVRTALKSFVLGARRSDKRNISKDIDEKQFMQVCQHIKMHSEGLLGPHFENENK
ncbi:hypothetical protein TNCV_2597591 [Trichonephila clavipes]|nr:hypothetical protein TNCV_2597591 [Trichonephila clavipes]